MLREMIENAIHNVFQSSYVCEPDLKLAPTASRPRLILNADAPLVV